MAYTAPVDEAAYHLSAFAARSSIGAVDGNVVDAETIRVILTQAGKLAADTLLPLDDALDSVGTHFADGVVRTAPGHREAYAEFIAGGWMGLALPGEWGGQELPLAVNAACLEFWHSGSMAFAMGTLLTMGAAETLQAHASAELKERYLAKIVSGEWPATMALTEAQSGSDLGSLRTRAEPAEGNSFRLFGTKMFISYGEHDLSENIIHLVLARLPDAPPGSRGISLFLVPKMLHNGLLPHRNDVWCRGVEKKLGQHGSPTCVMSFGEHEGAVGWMVGEPNKGLAAMFTMMNRARLAVATQGVAAAERACQASYAHAMDRRQGRAQGESQIKMSPIAYHPDVMRMLMTMRSLTSGARALALATADAIDRSRTGHDEESRASASLEADILTPVAKSFCTEVGIEVSSLAIQIHGGSGYVEETGVARLWRDVRIASIYEGTNGIQAIDLISRKLRADDGKIARRMTAEFRDTATRVGQSDNVEAANSGKTLADTCAMLDRATETTLRLFQRDPSAALFGATHYLKLFALIASCALLGRAYYDCPNEAPLKGHFASCFIFFAQSLLPECQALEHLVASGETLTSVARSFFPAGESISRSVA
ncbi:hypothetical protein SAMN05216374_3203 [Tardiphaga sp. OK246]|uniref:acyl-CoA dehydrogenase family protein n=1 Tax=Tardiphaga sp. OK246 TaxID=1855307 RepID=UPI000B6C5D98|nr:acyl-CoA dehydrogenase family protein [Tardiphaga sp. OK246]SNT32780.1 hypothetical protein SAMN05216374_3203 [Tardiphaga sp. OK246]